MFKEIINLEKSSSLSDLETIRFKFGVDSEEIVSSLIFDENVIYYLPSLKLLIYLAEIQYISLPMY